MDPFIQQRGQTWRSKDQHTTKVLLEKKTRVTITVKAKLNKSDNRTQEQK